MPFLAPDNFQKLTALPVYARACRIVAAGHIWRFNESDSPGSLEAHALVLDKAPAPFRVSWSNGEWQCECGSRDVCVHLTALLVKMAESRPEDTLFDAFRPGTLQPEILQPGVLRAGVSGAGTTGAAGTSREKTELRLSPDSHELFFTNPEPVQKTAVLVLAPISALQDFLKRRPAAKQNLQLKEFRNLTGEIWTIMAARAALRRDGTFGEIRPAGPEVCRLPNQPLHEVLDSSRPGALPVLSLSGALWTLHQAASVRLSFLPLPDSANAPLYIPKTELLAHSTAVSGALFLSGQTALILDGKRNEAAYLSDTGKSFRFLRLVLSRGTLSTGDIRALSAGPRKIPSRIHVIFPELPGDMKVLEPALVLDISEGEGFVDFLPRWNYKGIHVDGQNTGRIIVDFNSVTPRPLGLRNPETEQHLVKTAESILAAALSWRQGHYARMAARDTLPLRAEGNIPDLLAEFAAPLMEAGIELRLQNRVIRRGGILNIRTRKNGLVLEMQPRAGNGEQAFQNLQIDEWLDKSGMVQTQNAYFMLTDKALRQLHFLRDHGLHHTGFLRTSPDNLGLIDAVYDALEAEEETDGTYLRRSKEACLRLMQAADGISEATPGPPESFLARLRPYQFKGYQWLLTLWKEKLGGCLADDMGLGKTIQTLAYLSRLHADGRLGSSLIVGPVVTLGNWKTEIQRFAPALNTWQYSGPAEKRTLPPENPEAILIIVSYQTLRNDIEKFLEREWDHVILDEAHYVKNASSQTFKAVRALRSRHRISLTGTPLENHLRELWSQMSFLNPGILGSRSQFENRFVRPLEQEGKASPALSRLSAMAAPFILRRKKSQVLQDLPPKEETVVRCEMTPLQAEAYESMRYAYRAQVSGLLSDRSGTRHRMEIFTIISKLRLLAIHPPLAGEPFAGVDSGKIRVLEGLLEKILDEDHKILVFSQFIGALDRAGQICRSHNWPFSRLTGATKDRETPIRNFSTNPDVRVFLLSLKAGGVGINLTAADYVVLLDPWWNPAVEAQAMDRAHRMGQTKPVMAYRLITGGTIEERVLELQLKKKELAAGILGEGEVPHLNDKEIMGLFS